MKDKTDMQAVVRGIIEDAIDRLISCGMTRVDAVHLLGFQAVIRLSLDGARDEIASIAAETEDALEYQDDDPCQAARLN